MKIANYRSTFGTGLFAALALASAGCNTASGPSANANLNANSNVVVSNISNTNSLSNSTGTAGASFEAREPDQYSAKIRMTLEAVGAAQKTTLPSVGATIARMGQDRSMEFVLPNNEKVVYLEKGGTNYIILPNRKQYAELTKDAIGFEIRRMMSPQQIVDQLKAIKGVQPAGEQTVNGRPAMKYTYSATTNTNSQAGQVDTQSYFLIDKETGLPLRSETMAQSQNASVQGIQGIRLVTEMSDISTTPDANAFNVPTDYQKIDPAQVKAQVNLIFGAISAFVGQALQQANMPAASPAATVSPLPANR